MHTLIVFGTLYNTLGLAASSPASSVGVAPKFSKVEAASPSGTSDLKPTTPATSSTPALSLVYSAYYNVVIGSLSPLGYSKIITFHDNNKVEVSKNLLAIRTAKPLLQSLNLKLLSQA